MLGRFNEAVEEFRFFLNRLEVEDAAAHDQYSPTRLEWIASLQAGRNPFDEETLQNLLNK